MLYHVTKPENVPSILEHGLLRNHDGNKSAFVFLSEDPDSWMDNGLVLLGVDVDGLDVRMTNPCIENTDEICAWGDIPPERIKVLKMKIETVKIKMKKPKFAIVHHNRDNDENTYFAGFYNEVQCIGTEDESQCWENEEWVDNQDAAYFFDAFPEAWTCLENLDEDKQPDCKVVLYEYNDMPGFDGCHYFPLKEFKL